MKFILQMLGIQELFFQQKADTLSNYLLITNQNQILKDKE